MLNIAITAGGTSEHIDGVRRLTNISTGLLGWYCLETILDYFCAEKRSDFHVTYLFTETAFRKALDKEQLPFVDFVPVTDAESVYHAVDALTKSVPVNFFIHSMAISDFTLAYVASTEELAKEINSLPPYSGDAGATVREVLENPENRYSLTEKIPSDHNIILGLRRTQKVIPLIKRNNPNTFLVGFKLLKDVPEEELIRVANQLAGENGCDMVFANELAQLGESNHLGMLIRSGKVVDRPIGKKQIAEAIVREMMKQGGNK